MRTLSLLASLLALPAPAADPTKPNVLTREEITAGWLMLFDGESTFGWKVAGEAKVEEGVLVVVGGEKGTVLTSSAVFGPCEFRLQTAPGSGTGQVTLDTGTSQTGFGLTAQATRVRCKVRTGKGVESDVSVKVDPEGINNLTINATVDNPFPIRIEAKPGQTLKLHSVQLKPTGATPLFNGQDLTGWKVYPGAKDKKVTSRYSVTKEGWLNVKDGPGDIQTEGQWADFIVQLECISNGKHLNSGLFFRCIPDLYQQGYEAQIRNQWEGDDRTKPVDFGTGAIYRRQPARKVVSTDTEWFTLTVAARGRNIATWVDGFPVVAWTDDRPDNDNARQGFKKGKGALSIQGHDPTTDLSFRNIRVQSLDPK